jgi:two-component sensor histidine kinase
METLLDLLFERFDSQQAQELLRSAKSRAEAVARLQPELVAAGAESALLESPIGENLVLAVLSLRVKFPRDEALAKVRQNIAMRGR